jgi:formylglycine-generating enzyme required for sulfatase activity
MKNISFLKHLQATGLLIILIITACTPTGSPAYTPTSDSHPTETPLPTRTAMPIATPQPTGTPDPIAVFSDPILLAIQDRPPDFQDDFSSDANGWIIRTWPLDRAGEVIANGVMNLSLEQGGIADNHATSFRDFVVQVDVKFLDMVSNEGIGVYLEWVRYEVFDDTMKVQYFQFNKDKFWHLMSCTPVEPRECQEGPSGTALVDLSGPITIIVISKGTELAVYLNGTPLVYENFPDLPPASHIRLYAFDNSGNPGYSGAIFDNFKIWELQSVFPPDSPDPDLGVGSSWERPVDGMVMMYVPEGQFQMGSNFGGPDEQPVHAVYLDAFWIDQTEVTNAMYAKFLTEMGNQTVEYLDWLPPDHQNTSWFNPNAKHGTHIFLDPGESTWQSQSDYAQYPVNGVNYYGAQAYCAWAGGRLPTEAEWEKAARGGLEGKLYPWGDELPTCNIGATNGAFNDIHCYQMNFPPVGSFESNGYGLYDMVGSAGELTSDWQSSIYYAFSPYRNPLGPREGYFKKYIMVMRSSASSVDLNNLRLAGRGSSESYDHKGGFRCVRSP